MIFPFICSKGKVKTHKYINRQNQSTTGKLKTVMTLRGKNTWAHPRFWWDPYCVFWFVCLRTVSWVPNVASVFGSPILDDPFGFL